MSYYDRKYTREVTKLVATVDGKRYRLEPSASCKGCAFEHCCDDRCPVFNDYALAADIDVTYRELPEGETIRLYLSRSTVEGLIRTAEDTEKSTIEKDDAALCREVAGELASANEHRDPKGWLTVSRRAFDWVMEELDWAYDYARQKMEEE